MKKILLVLAIFAAVSCNDNGTKVDYTSKDSVVVDTTSGDSTKTIEIDSTFIDKK